MLFVIEADRRMSVDLYVLPVFFASRCLISETVQRWLVTSISVVGS